MDVNSLRSRVTDFQYFCQGESHSSKLVLRQGKVNKQVADVCTNPRKVRVGFSQIPGWFDVDIATNTAVKYPYYHRGYFEPEHNEMLTPFLHSHNLIATWIDTHGAMESRDDTGEWDGVVELVSATFFCLS